MLPVRTALELAPKAQSRVGSPDCAFASAIAAAAARMSLGSPDLAFLSWWTRAPSSLTNWTFASSRCIWRSRRGFDHGLSAPRCHSTHLQPRRWSFRSRERPDRCHRTEVVCRHLANRRSSIWRLLKSTGFATDDPHSWRCVKFCLRQEILSPKIKNDSKRLGKRQKDLYFQTAGNYLPVPNTGLQGTVHPLSWLRQRSLAT